MNWLEFLVPKTPSDAVIYFAVFYVLQKILDKYASYVFKSVKANVGRAAKWYENLIMKEHAMLHLHKETVKALCEDKSNAALILLHQERNMALQLTVIWVSAWIGVAYTIGTILKLVNNDPARYGLTLLSGLVAIYFSSRCTNHMAIWALTEKLIKTRRLEKFKADTSKHE